jgi:DNA-binding transcriptional LysR family regulator
VQSDADLRLLVALDALLHEQSVTRAAKRLHVSPPAMSRTLARIRERLGDPVLVQEGRQMVPTPRAVALRDRVRTLVRESELLLSPNGQANLHRAERTMTVVLDYAYTGTVIPEITSLALAQMPGLTFRFQSVGAPAAAAADNREADLAISSDVQLLPGTRTELLFRERYVAAVRAGRLISPQRASAQWFAEAGHIAVLREGLPTDPVDRALHEVGVCRKIVVSVPDETSAIAVARRTDLVATVQAVFARGAAASGLRVFALPAGVRFPGVVMAWHPRHDADPCHAWLRDLVRGIFAARPGA